MIDNNNLRRGERSPLAYLLMFRPQNYSLFNRIYTQLDEYWSHTYTECIINEQLAISPLSTHNVCILPLVGSKSGRTAVFSYRVASSDQKASRFVWHFCGGIAFALHCEHVAMFTNTSIDKHGILAAVPEILKRVRTCRCIPSMTCGKQLVNDPQPTHQIWTESAKLFLRYRSAVCTWARADEGTNVFCKMRS